MTQHRELVQQMLATLEAANAIIYEEFCGTTCPELHTCDETILAARAYLAAPEQKTWQIWCDTCEGGGTVDNTLGGDNTNATSHDDCPDCNGRGFNNRHAPQPTTPEPVNQMLLAALNACADALCNSQNFILSVSSDGFGAVCAEANGIAIDMANEILNAAEQAPQPTELTPKDIEALYMEHCPDDSLEAAIAFARAVLAAQKGKVK